MNIQVLDVLWDYTKKDYHTWVYKEEEINKILPFVAMVRECNRKVQDRYIFFKIYFCLK